MTPDVNVLVAASRADHPHHGPALAWLADALAGAGRGAALTVLPVVAVGFVRVVTQRRIFPVPTPLPQALAFLRALLDDRGAAPAGLGAEWPAFVRLCETHALAGGDVTDAWIAAAVQDQHEHLVTFDRGFRRFLGASALTVLTPDAR